MAAATEEHLEPTERVVFMLGGIDAKVDNVGRGVDELKSNYTAMQVQVNKNSEDIAVLKAQAPAKAPWYAVVGGFSGIGAIITVLITFFIKP